MPAETCEEEKCTLPPVEKSSHFLHLSYFDRSSRRHTYGNSRRISRATSFISLSLPMITRFEHNAQWPTETKQEVNVRLISNESNKTILESQKICLIAKMRQALQLGTVCVKTRSMVGVIINLGKILCFIRSAIDSVDKI